MEITVNGETKNYNDGATVADLLAGLDIAADASGVAVAVNHAVVPRGQWESVTLNAGDNVEIIQAVQGG